MIDIPISITIISLSATTIARDFPPIQEHITEEATLERTVNLFSNPKESSWEKSGFHHPLTEASQVCEHVINFKLFIDSTPVTAYRPDNNDTIN